MSRIVGIDLGTTNSLVAYVDGGIPRVIRDAEGRGLLPSIVAFTPAGCSSGSRPGGSSRGIRRAPSIRSSV